MGKQHLNLFPLSSWCHLIIGPGDIPRHIASAFMHGSHDLAGGRIRRAALPELTFTAVLHAGSVTNEPILVDTGTGRCEVAIGCPELMSTRAAIKVICMVEFEIRPCKRPVVAG